MIHFSIRTPDDFHTHLRDDARTPLATAHTAAQFGRAMCMPNLVPPVRTAAKAMEYQSQIMNFVPDGNSFLPLMTLYLTEETPIVEIEKVAANDSILAFKLYPAGATTNSDAGVKNWKNVLPQLQKMAELGVPLCVHGEVTNAEIDIFDREKTFYAEIAPRILDAVPNLKLICEHITTAEAADFVRSSGANVAGTITPQHLLHNRNALLAGGIRPHFYCLPVLKRERHRAALIDLATSGFDRIFAGTDSAPHAQNAKESACGCAGCYTAPVAVELYAAAFHKAINLSNTKSQKIFNDFMSTNGAHFYDLKLNEGTMELRQEGQEIENKYVLVDENELVPLHAGEVIGWWAIRK